MFQTTIQPLSLQNFKANFHGELVVPGDGAYDSTRRVWNGMINKYPALIARCVDSADVVRSVEFEGVAVDTVLRATERVRAASSSIFPR